MLREPMHRNGEKLAPLLPQGTKLGGTYSLLYYHSKHCNTHRSTAPYDLHMAGIPNDTNNNADNDGLTTNDTVTATVTRTIKTTNADGQETTVYSSTDMKAVTIDGDPFIGSDQNEESFTAEVPVSVTHIEHTKRLTTSIPYALFLYSRRNNF